MKPVMKLTYSQFLNHDIYWFMKLYGTARQITQKYLKSRADTSAVLWCLRNKDIPGQEALKIQEAKSREVILTLEELYS